MKFFIPSVPTTQSESAYQDMGNALKSQFRLPIAPRRIYGLRYFNSKQNRRMRVGETEQNEYRYEVTAIFESKCFMVTTRTPSGTSGPTILVDKSEVTEIEDFEAVVTA